MTAALAEPTRGELPPTRTYPRRGYAWEPAYPGQSDRDGTLEIWLVTGKRTLQIENDTYAVQIVPDECDVVNGVWSFMLENQDEPDETGPFACVVGGMQDSCGCEAAKYRLDCKHLAALRAIVKEVACEA